MWLDTDLEQRRYVLQCTVYCYTAYRIPHTVYRIPCTVCILLFIGKTSPVNLTGVSPWSVWTCSPGFLNLYMAVKSLYIIQYKPWRALYIKHLVSPCPRRLRTSSPSTSLWRRPRWWGSPTPSRGRGSTPTSSSGRGWTHPSRSWPCS